MPTKKKNKSASLGAYYGDPLRKSRLLRDMQAHMKADALEQGSYGYMENHKTFRGCAVGCSIFTAEKRLLQKKLGKKPSIERLDDLCEVISDSAHKRMAKHLNVPQMLARLDDFIFENLPIGEAEEWPLQFLKAIPIGADVSKVPLKLLQWVGNQSDYSTLLSRDFLVCKLRNPVSGHEYHSAQIIRDKLLTLLRECAY